MPRVAPGGVPGEGLGRGWVQTARRIATRQRVNIRRLGTPADEVLKIDQHPPSVLLFLERHAQIPVNYPSDKSRGFSWHAVSVEIR